MLTSYVRFSRWVNVPTHEPANHLQAPRSRIIVKGEMNNVQMEMKLLLSQRPYLSLIQQAALATGINIQPVETDMIYRLEMASHSWLMAGVDPGLNDSSAFQLAKQKSLSYAALAAAGVPAVPHHYMVNPQSQRGHGQVMDQAETWMRHYGVPMVIKPDDGAQGRQVTLAHDPDELRTQLTGLFAKVQHAVVSPYREAGKEYRVVVLDGQAHILFSKSKPTGEWRHNLALGAHVGEVEPSRAPLLTGLALDAAHTLGTAFCSVDILELQSGELQVLEVNGTVYLSEYIKSSPQARDAVYALFIEVFKLKQRLLMERVK